MIGGSVKNKLTLISRKSPLALWQAEFVKKQIEHFHPNVSCEIITRSTEGDRTTDKPLYEIGGKDLFVKDLQQALLRGEADIAVHSLKDMSTTDHDDLILAAISKREDPRDVLVSAIATELMQLPMGAIVGTTSPRRQCQLKKLRPDLVLKNLRGNIDTRLKKLDHQEYDAIILAAAGLKRLGWTDRIAQYLDPHVFIPAMGQGALAIECRREDQALQKLLKSLDDLSTHICVTAERAVNRKLNGDCHTPLAAYATLHQNNLQLSAMVGTLDGTQIIEAQVSGDPQDPEKIGLLAAEILLTKGAEKILKCL